MHNHTLTPIQSNTTCKIAYHITQLLVDFDARGDATTNAPQKTDDHRIHNVNKSNHFVTNAILTNGDAGSVRSGFGLLTPFVFRAELVHTLLNFVDEAVGAGRITGLRMLASVLRRTPTVTLTASLKRQLRDLRREMESMYATQQKHGLFSAYLCALVEVGVAMALRRLESVNSNSLYTCANDKDRVKARTSSAPMRSLTGWLENPAHTNSSTKDKAGGYEEDDIDDKGDGDDEDEEHHPLHPSQRQRTFDYLDDTALYDRHNGDGLLSTAKWFRDIVEVARIMEALVSPPKFHYDIHDIHEDDNDRNDGITTTRSPFSKARMPSSFLFAKDTFLKFILVAETVTLETNHPYLSHMNATIPSDRNVGARQCLIYTPGAESLELRFDKRCKSQLGEALVIYRHAGPDSLSSGKGRFKEHRALQGDFGGSRVFTAGDQVVLRFPLARPVAWAFDSKMRGNHIELSRQNLCATFKTNRVWQSVVCDRRMTVRSIDRYMYMCRHSTRQE